MVLHPMLIIWDFPPYPLFHYFLALLQSSPYFTLGVDIGHTWDSFSSQIYMMMSYDPSSYITHIFHFDKKRFHYYPQCFLGWFASLVIFPSQKHSLWIRPIHCWGQRINMTWISWLVQHLIPILDAIFEENLFIISKTITTGISTKLRIVENILPRATCNPKEVSTYKALI